MTRRSRSLSLEEKRLWSEYVRAVTPLPGRARPEPPTPAPAAPASVAPAIPDAMPTAPRRHSPPLASPIAPASPPLTPLDPKLRRKLRQGSRRADAVVDLHGMRQDEAHAALTRFLIRAQYSGYALVLVVTGKGAPSAGGFEERGILRRQVPHWLRLPALRPLVLGFEEAPAHQGGAGALYVRLRRTRQAVDRP